MLSSPSSLVPPVIKLRPGMATPSKRVTDFIGAALSLVLLSPLLALIAVLVRLSLGRPVLFVQRRPGLEERLFVMIKFRTMADKRDSTGNLLPDRERLTRLGSVLRKCSLDELPELWNVLKGEMSLVGPRPLLPEYLRRYTQTERRRHAVRPGITGWAQIHGRQTISFRRRIELDLWYINNWSLRLDLLILMKTVTHIFHGRGVQLEQDISIVDDLAISLVDNARKD